MMDRERVHNAVGKVLTNTSNYPREAQSRLLGRDLSMLINKTVDAVMFAQITEDEES